MCELRDVTKTATVQKGLIRSSVVYEKTILLLFDLKKDVEINTHQHIHTQMGYVFSGEFDFITDNKRYENLPLQNYIIRKNENHKVIATKDFYSMDIKYLDKSVQDEVIRYDVFQTIENRYNYKLEKVNLAEHAVYKLSPKSDQAMISFFLRADKFYCLAASTKGKILLNNIPYELQQMKFYECITKPYDTTVQFTFNSKDFYLLIFEIQKTKSI